MLVKIAGERAVVLTFCAKSEGNSLAGVKMVRVGANVLKVTDIVGGSCSAGTTMIAQNTAQRRAG